MEHISKKYFLLKQKNNPKKLKSYQPQASYGFALYIALIVMSVLSLVAFSVSRIAFSEINLSRIAKESQVAFYAADTGVECALYADIKNAAENYFPEDGCPASSPQIICAGQSRTVSCQTDTIDGYPAIVYSFQAKEIDGSGDEASCVDVEVQKINTDGDSVAEEIVIEASGKNTCDSNSRQIERGIRVKY